MAGQRRIGLQRVSPSHLQQPHSKATNMGHLHSTIYLTRFNTYISHALYYDIIIHSDTRYKTSKIIYFIYNIYLLLYNLYIGPRYTWHF